MLRRDFGGASGQALRCDPWGASGSTEFFGFNPPRFPSGRGLPFSAGKWHVGADCLRRRAERDSPREF